MAHGAVLGVDDLALVDAAASDRQAFAIGTDVDVPGLHLVGGGRAAKMQDAVSRDGYIGGIAMT
jgi:hypothetical protein